MQKDALQEEPRSNDKEPGKPWQEFRSAPLTPIACAVAAGLLLDRLIEPAVFLGCGLAIAAGLWAFWLSSPQARRALLALGSAGLAASYHHAYRHEFPADDLSQLVADGPSLLRVRGHLADDFTPTLSPRDDPFAPWRSSDQGRVVLDTSAVLQKDGQWRPASGLVRLTVEHDPEVEDRSLLESFRAGDEVEFLGWFSLPRGPSNPGERTAIDWLESRRIRVEAFVKDARSLTRLSQDSASFWILAQVRRAMAQQLQSQLSAEQVPVARALLVGDGRAMARTDWDKYIRTGVVHVLAISGQHLGIFASFLWLLVLLANLPTSRGAWIVLILIISYTCLTGLRPSGVRAAVMVACFCGSLILKRRIHLANSFCLAFIVVTVLNPTHLFHLGAQLSFLTVFVLIWGLHPWLSRQPLTPLERLIEESQPLWRRWVVWLGRMMGNLYLLNMVIALINAPLILAHYNLISLSSLLIGPPVVLLVSVALIAGFFLLMVSHLFGPVVLPLAYLVDGTLLGCNTLVTWADALPLSSVTMPTFPVWWTVLFYLLVVILILMGWPFRTSLALMIGSISLALLWPTSQATSDELRITVLSVGKGSCIVLECPDGRCLLYDVGSARGPGIVARIVAPYLWHRGISRIDEVILSHADTDHFNGLAELFRRFPIGTITLNPTFTEKPTREVAAAILTLKENNRPVRIAARGDSFQAGEVEWEVLHPPLEGLPGVENERSLVLKIEYAGVRVLFTGDLEKAGTTSLLSLPPQPVDVLLAPHHGSRTALPNSLLNWCQPKMIVVSRGQPYANTIQPRHDTGDIPTWDTETYGAVTLRCHRTGATAESYRTSERLVVSRARLPPR